MRANHCLRGIPASVLFFMAMASSAAASAVLPENPVGGSSVFVEKGCLHCHAIQGYGGTLAPDLARLRLSGGFLGMAGFMWNHAPKMITALAKEKLPLPRFTDTEMTNLVAFLYTLNYLDPPGDPLRGEQIFTTKHCRSCHSVGGEGGSVGPRLDKYGSHVSPLFVATGLWNSGPAMAEEMRRANIPRPDLSGKDVRDIVAFIRAQANRPPGTPPRIFARPGNPRTGASLFASKGCAGCHSPRAGRAEGGPPLAARELKQSLSTIASYMWNHGPEMWAYWKEKKLQPISITVEEMVDVTAYLYFLQFESPPGNPVRGSHIFINRGCASCHIPAEGRKPIGPDLRAKGPWASDIDLAREMWNHAGNMYSMLLSSTREWPRLNEKEVADLLAYIQSVGGKRKMEEKK